MFELKRPVSFRKPAMAGLLSAGVALAAVATPGHAEIVDSYAAAQRLSAETGLPILAKVGTEWCAACKSFDKTSDTDDFAATIDDKVVLVRIDAEKGDGVEFARAHRVKAYPTFVVTTAEGAPIDRWMGYESTERFTAALDLALTDPTTVTEKLARFRKSPTESDALKLGSIRMGEGLYGEAARYFERAEVLTEGDGQSARVRAFDAMSRGAYANLFAADELAAKADAVVSNAAATGYDHLRVLYGMQKAAMASGDRSLALPYLKAAYENTADDTDAKIQKKRKAIHADYVLHVQNDRKGAVKAKLAAMPEGWKSNANQLNNFAWWCFENELNLDQAEEFARKGVDLAEPGQMKANVLDTLAEICNLKGDCGDAVEYIQLAVAEAPESEYFREQLVRFQELLAAQSSY